MSLRGRQRRPWQSRTGLLRRYAPRNDKREVQHVGDILKKFNPTEAKYISREFQAYGYHLAEELQDIRRTSLYMKLAKTIHRSILEEALNFVKGARARNKAALFMWKLQDLRSGNKEKNRKGNF